MNATALTAYEPSVFLDTNAVHMGKLMLGFATFRNLDLKAADWDQVKAELIGEKLKHTLDSYKKGFLLLKYLWQRVEESAEVFYSPITRLELLCGSLRGEAVKRAASQGVPHRWYSRIEEEEIRLQLETDGYWRVRRSLNAVDEQFDSVGISLREEPLGPQIWECARVMLETVYLDVQDCLVYASAFVRQADEFASFDEYLAKVATYTENPGSAPPDLTGRFAKVSRRMLSWYCETEGWPKDQVHFPKCRRAPDMGKLIGAGA